MWINSEIHGARGLLHPINVPGALRHAAIRRLFLATALQPEQLKNPSFCGALRRPHFSLPVAVNHAMDRRPLHRVMERFENRWFDDARKSGTLDRFPPFFPDGWVHVANCIFKRRPNAVNVPLSFGFILLGERMVLGKNGTGWVVELDVRRRFDCFAEVSLRNRGIYGSVREFCDRNETTACVQLFSPADRPANRPTTHSSNMHVIIVTSSRLRRLNRKRADNEVTNPWAQILPCLRR